MLGPGHVLSCNERTLWCYTGWAPGRGEVAQNTLGKLGVGPLGRLGCGGTKRRLCFAGALSRCAWQVCLAFVGQETQGDKEGKETNTLTHERMNR